MEGNVALFCRNFEKQDKELELMGSITKKAKCPLSILSHIIQKLNICKTQGQN